VRIDLDVHIRWAISEHISLAAMIQLRDPKPESANGKVQ
jgi:hypothetical protein